MKKFLILTVGTLALVGSAFAQLIPVENVFAEVTFYNGDPENGGYELNTVPMNNSPIGNVVSGIENQNYVVLDVDGSSYTFKTFPGGSSKYSVYLDRGEANADDAMTLAEAIDGLNTSTDFAGTLDR